MDRIYRALRPDPQPQFQRPCEGTSLPADLAETVQRLVESSLQGVEQYLPRAALPPPPHTATADNISLPSQGPAPRPPRSPDAAAPLDPLDEQDAAEDGMDAPPDAGLPRVSQLPVPARVKQRIVQGEFTDFDTLLYDSPLPLRYGMSLSPSFSFRLSHDPSVAGDVLIAQQRPANRRAVHDLATWMEAWNVYVTILVASYPARALELLGYQRIICEASSRFPARCWLRYDVSFRTCTAADRSLRWDRKHDLWLGCFTLHDAQQPSPQQPASAYGASWKPARRPCTYCGNLFHLPHNCTHSPFRGPRPPTMPLTQTPTGATPSSSHSQYHSPTPNQPPFRATNSNRQTCKDFNNLGCTHQQCRFRHASTRCGGTSHGERECMRTRNVPPPY